MDEARKELERIIQDREMKDALLLVFANKQDVRGCECPCNLRGTGVYLGGAGSVYVARSS